MMRRLIGLRLVDVFSVWIIASTAYGQGLVERTIDLQCAPGEMILLPERDRIHQYEPEGSAGNCHVTSRLYTMPVRCAGRQTCTVTAFFPVRCGTGERLRVNHTCVPVEEVNSECGDTILDKREGYITSPNYPKQYRPNELCSWTISTPSEAGESGKPWIVHIWVYDMDLQRSYNATLCRDYVEITRASGSRESVFYKCEDNQQQVAYLTLDGAATVTFRTDKYSERKGFFMRYELTEGGSTVTRPTTTTARPYQPGSGVGGSVRVTPVPEEQSSEAEEGEEVTYKYAIAGIVVGVIIVILILIIGITFIYYFLKKRDEKEEKLHEGADVEKAAAGKGGAVNGSYRPEEESSFTEKTGPASDTSSPYIDGYADTNGSVVDKNGTANNAN